MKARCIFLAMTLATLVAACGNSSPGTAPTPSPCVPPPGAGALPQPNQSVLVYPAPNATAVPDQFGQVIIGSQFALPSSWNVVLVTALSPYPPGAPGGTFTTVTPPFPQPNATPSFANPVYQSSSFAGATFPGEVVQVYLNDTSSSCTPSGPLGQFTTQ